MQRRRMAFANLFALAAALTMTADSTSRADEAVYQRVVKSTVLIATPSKTIGAGTLIDAERRVVVTANHVVASDDMVVVFFADFGADGQPITEAAHYCKNMKRLAIRGKVVAREPGCDLALIQLESLPRGAVALPLAAEPRPGESVHAIGHSSIKRNAVFSYSAKGVVRNVYNLEVTPNLPLRGRIVETSLPTNHGDSGGPVVNDRGELVAVVSRGTTGAAAAPGTAFADEQVVDLDIANTEVRRLLRRTGFPVPGTAASPNPLVVLGIRPIGETIQSRMRLLMLTEPLPSTRSPLLSAPPMPPRSYLSTLVAPRLTMPLLAVPRLPPSQIAQPH